MLTNGHKGKWTPYEDDHAAPPVRDILPGTSVAFREWLRFRWTLRYPFQYRLLCGFTVGEIFIVLPLLIGSLALGIIFFVREDLTITGFIATAPFIVVFILACRNSLVTFLIGIPFERQIEYHRYSAWIGAFLGLLHGLVLYEFFLGGIGSGININNRRLLKAAKKVLKSTIDDPSTRYLRSDDDDDDDDDNDNNIRDGDEFLSDHVIFVYTGWTLQGAIFGLVVTSLFPLRRKFFEFFYRSHWVLFIVVMVFGVLHKAQIMLIGSGLWFFDVAYRAYLAGCYNPKRGKFTLLPAEVIRVSFIKPESFKYKPGQYVFLCVPQLSLFEWHPFSISSAPMDDKVSLHIRVLGDWTKSLYDLVKKNNEKKIELSFYIEGPYGEPTINIDDSTYKHFLLVSGGIGITPMFSIANTLQDQLQRGRAVEKVHTIWSVRDRFLVKSVFANVKKKTNNNLPYSFQPDILRFSQEVEKGKGKNVFITELFLTKPRKRDQYKLANILPEEQHLVRMGRPDLERAFGQMREMAATSRPFTRVRVAVLCCGPASLVDDAEILARKFSDRFVVFDFHKETFEF